MNTLRCGSRTNKNKNSNDIIQKAKLNLKLHATENLNSQINYEKDIYLVLNIIAKT